ncbi:hypothetical protein D3C72_385890 [compost metagenome]
MRQGLGLLLACILVAGCAAPTLTGAPPASQPAVGPLGGLTFKPISAQNTRYIGSFGAAGSSVGVPAPAAAPSMTPSASPLSPGGVASGNVYGGGYGYGYAYVGGPSVPMALVSVTEAEAAGSRGPLKAILETLVAPVLKDWAPDAHLVSSSGSLDAEGRALVPSPSPSPGQPAYGYYGGYDAGWRLSYASPTRQEALNFHVMADKTLVIRMRWAPLNLAATPIGVDADEAVKKLTAAIEDATFKAEEEKTGTDYFFGTAFQPAPVFGAPGPYQERVESVYDVPPEARWNATLQSILGKQVWELYFYRPYTETDPPPSTGYWFDNSARGMVDAQTGGVIRFTRPSKRYYPTGPSAMPLPPNTGSPAPSPVPPTQPPSPSPSVMPSA